MNNLFIDCSFGVSGDMLLAAFLDLGVPIDVIKKPLKLLGLSDSYTIQVEESRSNQFRGLKVFVEDQNINNIGRSWLEIRRVIEGSNLNISLKMKVKNVFKTPPALYAL